MSFDNSLFRYDVGYYEYTPGMWMPGKLLPEGRFTWSREAVDAARNVQLRDTDVMVATYPKTGQTWTMAMIHQIMHSQHIEAGEEAASVLSVSDLIPFIETERLDGVMGAELFEKNPDPRFMKTHLPLKLWKENIEKHPNIKIIHTTRNPKDALVSWFHHMKNEYMEGGFTGTWDQFFEELVKKERLPWGDYFKATATWYEFLKDRKNTLIMRYEEMKKDHRGHVFKIATFLDQEITEKVADVIVEKTSFGSMSKEINSRVKQFALWNKEGDFVRKGKVGDWENYFSKEQNEYVDAKCKEYLEPLGLKFEYQG